MAHSVKWFLQSTCPTDKCIQFEIWKPVVITVLLKTFMVHQTFVRWALCILFKFVKSLVRHLGLAIGNIQCVRWFLWTLMIPYKLFWYWQITAPALTGHMVLHARGRSSRALRTCTTGCVKLQLPSLRRICAGRHNGGKWAMSLDLIVILNAFCC